MQLTVVSSKDSTNHINESIFHSPDKQFFDFCSVNYRINRGIFNVIDSWFYDYGWIDIITRRKVIVQYLTFLCENEFYNEKKLFLQFGKGGVKGSLILFIDYRC
ncbi:MULTISPECIES: hypothetical protein [Sporosarcina]|uniref:Uncharacterized protein n=1 Tax=Sporosarcina newyorkensis TaxID=759851 RepID=A0A1T4XYH3_9BACL|nr:hypothetical protein [Sporosarcina newyorkensis]SKA94443.1 hypothetical protein SAMN04244570_1424 [Sporosarcina newyorkensis]